MTQFKYRKRYRAKDCTHWKKTETVEEWQKRGGQITYGSYVKTPQEAKRFYQSKAWLDMRKRIHRNRNRGYCDNCGVDWWFANVGLKGMKPCVDHMKPLRRNWELRLEESNLQILCESCNSHKANHTGLELRDRMKEMKKKRLMQVQKILANKQVAKKIKHLL